MTTPASELKALLLQYLHRGYVLRRLTLTGCVAFWILVAIWYSYL